MLAWANALTQQRTRRRFQQQHFRRARQALVQGRELRLPHSIPGQAFIVARVGGPIAEMANHTNTLASSRTGRRGKVLGLFSLTKRPSMVAPFFSNIGASVWLKSAINCTLASCLK